jgi:membrane protease YdiL (CAAX protease family)
VIRTTDIEIQWRVVGDACLRLGLAFGAGFLVLALLDAIPAYRHIAENSPWIPRYIGDSIAFAVGLIIIWRVSQGRLHEYGSTLAGRNLRLKLNIALGVVLGLTGALLDHLPEVIVGNPIEPAYPLTLANVLGMLSFQWVFVGIFEETITRGLVQTPLMNELKGTITLFRWDFHVGSVITAVMFGVGHFGPHVFFGDSWLSLVPHLALATAYGLCSSYIYQETRSLAGPILMHNVVDGLLTSIDCLLWV